MKTPLLAILALLAGCATAPKPEVVIGSAKPIEVPVVLTKPCLEPGQIPPFPANAMPARTADIEQKATGASVNAERYMELARVQRDLLLGCAKLQETK